jgi:transcriptional regulator with XRE-family HTH domain
MTHKGDDSFARHLRQWRQRAGFTQEELAERARLTPNAISALERGERTHPYPNTIRALAEALGPSAPEHAALAASVPQRGVTRQPPETATGSAHDSVEMPAVDSRLIGRARELESVNELVSKGARIVTLTGPGGVGKTRLALALAGVLRGDFPDGVAFVVLAPLSDAALVIPTIASALAKPISATSTGRSQ